VSSQVITKRFVRPKQLTRRAVVKAHSRSLGLPNFLLVLVVLASFMRFFPTENRTRGYVSKQRGRKFGFGMTKWGFALPCNVVADGWIEPPQKTNLDKTGWSSPGRESWVEGSRNDPVPQGRLKMPQDAILGYLQP
jgi:hypothetical protein